MAAIPLDAPPSATSAAARSRTSPSPSSSSSPPQSRPPARRGLGLGKYREIVFAVALFLVLDLGVLALNFTISSQIADDAVGINLAGRQRMLSQRMTKALLSLESAGWRNALAEDDRQELAGAVKLFDETLQAFSAGGPALGGDDVVVRLQPIRSAEGLQVIRQARALWEPYRELLVPVMSGTADPAQMSAAVAYARDNNVRLLGQMNALTSALERAATGRTNMLRAVQAGAILLALLNFAFILFKFLRRLNRSDEAAELSAAETSRILHTVSEGLLLIDRRGRVGRQMSSSVPRLFGRPVTPGQDFISLLEPMIERRQLQEAREYIDLLFSPHVRPGLMHDLNPLTEVEARIASRLGDPQRRYLAFDFSRVGPADGADALLVTVQDVTASVELARALRESRQQAGIELSVLAEMLSNDRSVLLQFVTRCKDGLLEINRMLESSKALSRPVDLAALVARMGRKVHAIKGDAAALRLAPFVSLCSAFEDALAELRASATELRADALLAVPLPLDDLLQKTALFERILTSEMSDGASGERPGQTPQRLALEAAAREAARDLGKQVQTQVDVTGLAGLPSHDAELVHDLMMQLVRNAVAHGIERPEERVAAGKLAVGFVQAWCRSDGGQMVEVGVRDDGAGIDPATVRANLVASGQLKDAEARALTDAQLVQLLLRPGYSTAGAIGAHAGRGIGLDLVGEAVRRFGAQLRVMTRPHRFSEFSLRFSV